LVEAACAVEAGTMTIRIKVTLTPEAQQKLDEISEWLNSPETRAKLAQHAEQYFEQRRRERHAEMFQQMRESRLRWDLYRSRRDRPRWMFARDERNER
jgi:hypothetical protein